MRKESKEFSFIIILHKGKYLVFKGTSSSFVLLGSLRLAERRDSSFLTFVFRVIFISEEEGCRFFGEILFTHSESVTLLSFPTRPILMS